MALQPIFDKGTVTINGDVVGTATITVWNGKPTKYHEKYEGTFRFETTAHVWRLSENKDKVQFWNFNEWSTYDGRITIEKFMADVDFGVLIPCDDPSQPKWKQKKYEGCWKWGDQNAPHRIKQDGICLEHYDRDHWEHCYAYKVTDLMQAVDTDKAKQVPTPVIPAPVPEWKQYVGFWKQTISGGIRHITEEGKVKYWQGEKQGWRGSTYNIDKMMEAIKQGKDTGCENPEQEWKQYVGFWKSKANGGIRHIREDGQIKFWTGHVEVEWGSCPQKHEEMINFIKEGVLEKCENPEPKPSSSINPWDIVNERGAEITRLSKQLSDLQARLSQKEDRSEEIYQLASECNKQKEEIKALNDVRNLLREVIHLLKGQIKQ